MNKFLNSMKILRNLGENELVALLFEYFSDKTEEKFNDLIAAIYRNHAEDNLSEYVTELILKNVNPFSVSCAEQGQASMYLKLAYLADLKAILHALKSLSVSSFFDIGEPISLFRARSDEKLISNLLNFYTKKGYGSYIDAKAFIYKNGDIVPVTNVRSETMESLKDYQNEKQAIINNVDDFLGGLPYSHMLLYGDRGTGKSSTVHAVLNKNYDRGLRLIELDKNDIGAINEIRQRVCALPLKFIIFIDDLSLSDQDENISTLKAAVEGTTVNADNVMVVATSNRRHVVKETFTERDNSIHPSDSIEEQLSLSDRFGLTVMFSSTDKAGYLSIVDQLAADMKLKIDTEQLNVLAERWAIVKGGRSPRRAKQFVDFAYSCEHSGREIEF